MEKKPAPRLRSQVVIIGAVVLSLVLSFLPVVNLILIPFDFFTTFIHEGGHAIASLLMGEDVSTIVINPDTSGYMQHTVTSGRFAQGFIASAGYMGASLFGGIMIMGSSYARASKLILVGLGVIFAVAIALYVRDLFTLFVAGGWAAGLIGLGVKGSDDLNFFAVNFLAIQCALNSVQDVLTLLRLSMGAPKSLYSLGHSDADAVAELFWLPAIVWSGLWIVLSCGILYFAMRKSAAIRSGKTMGQPVGS